MAQKSLYEFSIPAITNVPTGPAVNIGDKNFGHHGTGQSILWTAK
jgi:hypothetical protein